MHSDPLAEFLLANQYRDEHTRIRNQNRTTTMEQQHAELHTLLDKLTAALDAAGSKKVDYGKLVSGPIAYGGLVELSADDIQRMQAVYYRMAAAGGPGNTFVQEKLLKMLALSADPTTIPFWQTLLDINHHGDSFAHQRRQMALAALTLIGITYAEPAAYSALQTATRHANVDARAMAIGYLGRAYFETNQSLPAEVQAYLTEIATYDRAFLPRFKARMLLRAARLPVPLDNPDGAYAFKVTFLPDKQIYRTLEVRSTQTLDHLQRAFHRIINWDTDHLYAFFLNGRAYDPDYQCACPMEQDAAYRTNEAVIGELGLAAKQKFLYLFDYGDNHKFEVEVVAIHSQADAGDYPRMVESNGRAPAQYHAWNEEDEYEEDYDEDYA